MSNETRLTRTEVASLFGVRVRTVDYWSKKNKITPYKNELNGRVHFLASEIYPLAESYRQSMTPGEVAVAC